MRSAEKGDFLALDLGGTNFRVLHVRVEEEAQKVLKMDSQICAIPQEMMLGTGEQVTQMHTEGKRSKRKHANPQNSRVSLYSCSTTSPPVLGISSSLIT